MAKTVLLVTHHADDPRDDRASRIVAEFGCRTEWVCPRADEDLPEPDGRHVGAIVYGGPHSVNETKAHPYMRRELDWAGHWVDAGKPYLGFCLGGQILAHALGARVGPHPRGLHEMGYFQINPTEAGRGAFAGAMNLYQCHYEGFEVPASGELLATGEAFPNQAFRYGENAYGFQFHPEVTPVVLRRWLDKLEARLSKPGVHSRERQVADCARYDQPMEHWLEGFIGRWLAAAQGRSRK